jgi:hypothetical protein
LLILFKFIFMDDKKQEETTPVSTDTASNDTSTIKDSVEAVVTTITDSVSESATSAVDAAIEVSDSVVDKVFEVGEAARKPFNIKAYVGAVAVILLISVGLMFVLEKEGRISTGLFSGLISKMEARSPAVRVNDVKISKSEFNSSVKQLTEMAVAQGADASDPAVAAQFKTQAIETLVNAELLRQAAVSEGMTATPEQIETRFNEIRDGIGGAEQLAAKMAEFGVTEVSLRRDIENEFLIQGLFDVKIATSTIEVSETEIAAFYEKAGGVAAGLPPIAEVREQVDAQVRFEKEQVLINAYLQTLKADAEVEILI